MSDIDIFAMEKQSGERRTRTVDFSEKISDGVTISSATAALVKMPTLEDMSATMLASTTATVSGDNVSFTMFGGEDGCDYKITVTATLSSGDILTADIFLSVKDY